MICSTDLFDAIYYRLNKILSKDDTTVEVSIDGNISILSTNAHHRIYCYDDVKYMYVLNCRINLNDEQYTRLKLMAIEFNKKNEERLIKYLYNNESTSN